MTQGTTLATHCAAQIRSAQAKTRLRRKRRAEDPMREFDRLPPDLRAWLTMAALPWRPRSVQRAFEKALKETGDRSRALAQLSALQGRIIAKDTAMVFGPNHPSASAHDTRPTDTQGRNMR